MKADYGKNKTDNYGIRNLEGKTDDHSAEFLMKGIFAFVLQINYGKNRYENLFLPAARTGFILTKDLVNQVGREQTFNMEPETKPMSPFTRPINQFLDVINVLSLENQPSAKRRKIIDLIEHQMTSGTIEISDSPNKEIRYVTETESGEQKSLSLRTVSAVVTELSPLILLLKHMENIESLCYEESEMCLHPQLQHQMGRVMARIVNSGIDVIATTHSDILLQSINNKIALKSHPQKEDLCKKLQLEEEDLLLDTQVKVYQFQEHNGKSQLIEIPCGQNGFAVPTFNNALDDIMGEAYMVQGNSDNKRTFVISELMQNNFIEETEQKVLLEETEESGKSLLKVQLPNAQKIFCIKNVDKKHTDMYFFKADQKYSMMKRVELNFGEKIPFDHEKVQMSRNTDGLKGNVQMK